MQTIFAGDLVGRFGPLGRFEGDLESLLGHNKRQRIEAFVGYFQRRDSLGALLDWLRKIRDKEQ